MTAFAAQFPFLVTLLTSFLAWLIFPLPPKIEAFPPVRFSAWKAFMHDKSLPNSPLPFPGNVIQPSTPASSAVPSVQNSAPALAAKYLPLEWILNPHKGKSLTDRILAQVALAEAKEPDHDLKQNYRQAFICIALAAKDEPIPFIQSSYICYGKHPDKVWPAIVARRKAQMGPEYSVWYDAAGNRRPDAPKKESSSESIPRSSEEAA